MATSYTTNYHLIKPDYTDDADIYDVNTNMDTLDSTIKSGLDGKKNVQTAVSDPTASGTGITFIKTISQNTQGVITPAKGTVREMTGANGSTAGSSGLVPAPAAADNTKFLRGDKTWATPTNTDTKNTAGSTDTSSKIFLIGATSQAANPQTYSHDTAYVGTDGCLYSGGTKVLTAHQDISGKKNTQSAVSDPSANGTSLTFISGISQNAQGVISPAKKTVSTMGAASASAAGSAGLVPQPGVGNQGKFLRGDGTWQIPTNTTYSEFTGATSSADGAAGLVKKPLKANKDQYLKGDGTWGTPTNTTYNVFSGASGSAAGSTGLVKQPAAGDNGKFLRGDCTWATPTNTTYSAGTGLSLSGTTFNMANSGATAGTYGPTANVSGTNGTTIKVPKVKIDATGRVTEIAEYTYTSVDTNTTYSTFTGASSSAAGAAGLVKQPAAGEQAKFLRGDCTWAVPTNTDTKNTAGSTNTTSKIFLCGATSQAADPQTYSNVNCFAQNGFLYSGGSQVLTSHQSLANYVTTNTTQDITGVKTFRADTVIGSTTSSTSPSSGAFRVGGGMGVGGAFYCGGGIHGTVANDYAEYRKAETNEPGRVVRESASGTMVKTDRRRMRGCKVISDTFGFSIGETDEAKTPVGVTGRVLAYPARDRSKFYLGAPVCSGPNGTVDVMSRLEAILFPECIIGTVSEIPKYEKWTFGVKKTTKEIDVDGRIWIYVR